ncbi:hypothetical protein BGZ70_006758 [Mortierella alpina]|uniref:RNI-like protein n=1 Tax=Mortierella alpina TaxID=64518 RepID=A0A9P6JHF2_MORAP|nr:hypothetical protein BGZ70_006758 [Mortierella alpina]
MEETQSFRLFEDMNVLNISVDCGLGQNVVYWEDIEQVFPGVKHIQKGSVVINMVRGSDGKRIVPHRIKHYPGVVLDVVLSTALEHVQVNPLITNSLASGQVATTYDTPADSSVTDPPVDDAFRNKPLLRSSVNGSGTIPPMRLAASLSSPTTAEAPCDDLSPIDPRQATIFRRSTAHIQRDVKVAADAATEALIARNRAGKTLDGSTALSVFEDNLPAEYRESLVTLQTVVRELKAIYDQGHVTQHIVRQVLAEAQQIKDRLILIERKTAAILTQNYELLEFTIPRLFIVLPDAATKWDPKTMIYTKFRLHFICECGEHTMPTIGNKMPHHLHLAHHEGYAVNKPTEFFRKYGPFLMLMLEMIKFGTGIAGFVVPALASLKVVDIVDGVQSTMDSVTKTVIQGVDYSLAYLERSCVQVQETDDPEGNATMLHQDFMNYLAGVEGLEGADLRQLGSFLTANSSDNLLGNLFRMTTKDGHVKWVCREHYRAGLEEELTQKLRDVVKLAKGEFDEQMGKIKISFNSSFAAAEFYDAVRKAKGVLDLDVSILWSPDYGDFVKLRNMISLSKIRLITLRLVSTSSDDAKGDQYYDPILDLMRLPSVHAVEINGLPRDFFKRSSPLPKKTDLSKLTRLQINGPWSTDKPGDELKAEIATLKLVISKAPNISFLHLDSTTERLPAILSSIGKYQTYPIDFGNLSLRLAPPLSKHRQSKADVQNIEHICSTYGAQFETLDLNKIGQENVVVESLAKAIRNGSSLKEITLKGFGRNLDGGCIKTLGNIVAHCELRKLQLDLETQDGRVCILDSIQWRYLRELDITLHEDQGAKVLTALIDGMRKMSENVELESLSYTVHPKPHAAADDGPSSLETKTVVDSTSASTSDEENLLPSLMSLASPKQLAISSQLSLVRVLALLQSVNFPRLQLLSLGTGRTVNMQHILYSLHTATQLHTIALPDANVTDEMKEQMLAKGITLIGDLRQRKRDKIREWIRSPKHQLIY